MKIEGEYLNGNRHGKGKENKSVCKFIIESE